MNHNYLRWLTWAVAAVTALTVSVILAVSATYVYLQPSLPTVEAMRATELQVPLRIYSRSGQLIAQIGEQRRIPVAYEQIPDTIKQAFIAAEDDRFFEHHGFDYQGILRSALVNLVKGARAQGASTITMQTARNMFLSQDRTWRRKLQEVFLTYRLEREFSKAEILGLYLNVISFGKRAYGVAAAAETYFGKTLDQLTLAEAATLARVPQAPSRYNPIADPEAAAQRRGYVLRRMTELGFIDAGTAAAAAAETVKASIHSQSFEVEAPYVAEMVRLEVLKRFGAAAQNICGVTAPPACRMLASSALRPAALRLNSNDNSSSDFCTSPARIRALVSTRLHCDRSTALTLVSSRSSDPLPFSVLPQPMMRNSPLAGR